MTIAESNDPLNVSLLAALLGAALSLALGPRTIRWLGTWTGDRPNQDSPTLRAHQASKVGTPTMGGLFLIVALLGSIAATAELSNTWVQAAVIAVVGLGSVGAIDDLRKLRGNNRGLSRREKLVGQLLVAATVAGWLVTSDSVVATLFVPGRGAVTLGPWLAVLCIVVMLATTNAVNLADGLDGLAAGCVLPATLALGTLLYFKPEPSDLFDQPAAQTHSPRALLAVTGAVFGATAGFLRFNRHPARVFMGDTGALALGGLLGLLAIASGRAWAWLLIGGVFVAETVSVILQIGWFRWTGRRMFRCAPLHHHFQFAGHAEGTIVRRFWWAAIGCALFGALLGSWTLRHEAAAINERAMFAARATVAR